MFNATLYQEENDIEIPGASKLFKTREEAEAWARPYVHGYQNDPVSSADVVDINSGDRWAIDSAEQQSETLYWIEERGGLLVAQGEKTRVILPVELGPDGTFYPRGRTDWKAGKHWLYDRFHQFWVHLDRDMSAEGYHWNTAGEPHVWVD